MLLKRLTLQGYKTFAVRTEFEFDSGITAIVGPNGSGKSNIADAIRWVLGEQRPSNLRIKLREDLIFAGSRQRPRQGMAEVSITLDNAAHWLPLDYEEITIRRRLYRSGESEYRVNGARMRARDIAEILTKGGLSRDTYVVIGQGLVDAALSLRPIERRSLFEAAAGISGYQSRKEEALRRLEETRLNLVRINDILTEIAPHLARLQAQAQRAEEHTLLTRDLKELLRIWYAYHWQRRWADLQQAETREAELTEFLTHHQVHIKDIEEQLKDLSSTQAALRRNLSLWHQESSRLHAQIEEKSRNLAVMQERHRLLSSQHAELEREISQLEPQYVRHTKEIEAIQLELTRLASEREQAATSLRQARAKWEKNKRNREQLDHKLRQAQKQALRIAMVMADHKSRLSELAQQRTETVAESQQLRKAISKRKAILAKLAETLQAQLIEERETQSILDEMEIKCTRARGTLEEHHEHQERLDAKLQAIQQKRSTLYARQRMLQRMRDEFTGYHAGVRSILDASARGQLEGIHGPIVRLMRSDPKFDAAIEVAVGSHLQDIIVDHWTDAEAAIALLKRTRGGRATLLPLDSIQPLPPPTITKVKGIVGLASQLIEFDRTYQKAFDLLLNRTLIITGLAAARQLVHRLDGNLRLVTLDGDLVTSNGSVSGGSRQETDGRITSERDWREIPRQLAALNAQKGELENRQQQEAQILHQLAAELEEITQEIAHLRKSAASKSEERDRLEQRQERLREEIAWYDHSLQRLDAAVDAFQARAGQLEADLQSAEKDRAAAANITSSLQEQLERFTSSESQRKIASLETALALAERNQAHQESLLQNQQLVQQRLATQISSKKARAIEMESTIQQISKRIQELQAQTSTLRTQLEALRRRIEPTERQVTALDQEERAAHADEERAHARLYELERQAQQASLEKRHLRDELNRLEEEIGKELGPVPLLTWHPRQLRLGLEEIEPGLPNVTMLPNNLEGEIKELRARLRRLGTINPNAPKEYRKEQERHTFLSSQAADLEKASQSIRDVISELDDIMQHKFIETFSAVAREFTAYFNLLFGGGTAKLTLTDPNDLDNTGVEIIARPPGKRLQSLALLSGGERALTATALLFAILKTNPLPFCVLDEVDAMLDEANVGRFRDILQEMSRQTQFVVITHNRHTINAANTIYGISMRRDGVSAVLSLRLDEAEQQLENAN